MKKYILLLFILSKNIIGMENNEDRFTSLQRMFAVAGVNTILHASLIYILNKINYTPENIAIIANTSFILTHIYVFDKIIKTENLNSNKRELTNTLEDLKNQDKQYIDDNFLLDKKNYINNLFRNTDTIYRINDLNTLKIKQIWLENLMINTRLDNLKSNTKEKTEKEKTEKNIKSIITNLRIKNNYPLSILFLTKTQYLKEEEEEEKEKTPTLIQRALLDEKNKKEIKKFLIINNSFFNFLTCKNKNTLILCEEKIQNKRFFIQRIIYI